MLLWTPPRLRGSIVLVKNNCYHCCRMPTDHIVALLIAERDKLNAAITALQGAVKRRGRPPKNAAAFAAAVLPGPRKRRRMSAARRKAQAERMKAYWAKRKKEAAKKS
jgi:hypothetical protein